MRLLKTISKTKKHAITYVVKENGKEVKKTKEVPNSCLWLVLDSGVKVLINAVKDEDKKILNALANVEYVG